MILRLANADVVPFDYVEFARTMRGRLPTLGRGFASIGDDSLAAVAPLAAAIDRMERAATAFATARDGALAGRAPDRATLERANAALRGVERALTRPEGLRTRPWFRGLVYAADEDNGYATIVFPSVNEAIRRRDRALAAAELADLAARFDRATAALDEARSALAGARRR
jgi:N-acetylated-alpha-linked acidic dipeptidase